MNFIRPILKSSYGYCWYEDLDGNGLKFEDCSCRVLWSDHTCSLEKIVLVDQAKYSGGGHGDPCRPTNFKIAKIEKYYRNIPFYIGLEYVEIDLDSIWGVAITARAPLSKSG